MPGWICPQCRRTVPERIAVCPCGAARADGRPEVSPAREAGRVGPSGAGKRSRVSAAEVASVAALVALYLGAVWKLGPPQPGRAPQPVPPTEAAMPRAEPPAPPAEPSLASPSWLDQVPPPSTTPPPWTQAQSYDSPRAGSDATADPAGGERRLEDALQRLSIGVDWLNDSVPRFRASCLGARTDSARCDAFRGEIVRVYSRLEASLRDACAAALRDGVLPQTVHALRARHHVDEREWGDLASTIERLNADGEGPS